MNLHLVDQPVADRSFRLADARIVLADRVVRGRIDIEDGRIAAIEETADVPRGAIDCAGDIVLPGLVDLHTDHFEKHVFPRAHVRWDPMAAALAHDAQIIGGAVTTVFDSVCAGSAEDRQERREILKPMIEALRLGRLHDMFRAEHLVHLRCEIIDPETPACTEAVIDHDFVRLISVMDHTPGDRQSRDIEAWIYRNMTATRRSREDVLTEYAAMKERSHRVGIEVKARILEMARARGLPVMSHDDATPAQVAEAKADGVAVSEFPTTIEAAEAARAAGMLTIAGAPNLMRGGSQSGNVAVRDLLERKLVDILASDYVPRSMFDACFRIAEDPTLPYDLPAAVALVTANPARAAALDDRGTIARDLRADLVRVRRAVGHPVAAAIWREGRRVA